MRSIVSPLMNRRTVPFVSLTTTDMAFVTRLIAAAAQWRVPNPLESVRLAWEASMIWQARSTLQSAVMTMAPSS